MRIERGVTRFQEQFDLVVIGGGITGVNVAREASGRGLHVCLVDKGDFGAGTSSATSKLIHGGIRYLESKELGVVRESLRERRVLALGAPHLVEPRRFLLPTWSWSRPRAAVIGAGVGLYTALGFDRNRNAPASLRMPLPRWLSKSATRRAVPWLDPDELQGAFAYHDVINVHPERLLLSYLKSAVRAGAVVANHVEATGFVTEPRDDGTSTVTAVDVEDRLTGTEHTLRARAVVNAAGPWLDLVLERLGRSTRVSMTRSKGVHVLTRPLGGRDRVTDTVLVRTRGGGHVLVSPWQDLSLIGPTDTAVDASPDDVRTTRADVDELLATVNASLARDVTPLTVDDVTDTTVGTRPLIANGGSSSYRVSRRHEIFDHRSDGLVNLWSIGGGKWTTGRAMGVAMVDELLESSPLRAVITHDFDSSAVAVDDAFAWADDAGSYLEAAASSRPEIDLSPAVRLHLARLYGTQHQRVLDLVADDPTLGRRISDREGCLDITAQAVYAVVDEGARTLSDIVDRRLVLGTLGPVSRHELERIAVAVGPLFGLDHDQMAAAVDAELARRETRRALWRAGATGRPSDDAGRPAGADGPGDSGGTGSPRGPRSAMDGAGSGMSAPRQ